MALITATKTNAKLRIRSLRFSSLFPYLLLAPAILLILLLILYPLLTGLYISLTNRSLVSLEMQMVGLRNYAKLWQDPVFLVALKNSLIWTVYTVGVQLLIGLPLALLLNTRIRGRGFFRTFLLMPWTMPTIVVGIIFTWLYHPVVGYLNYLGQLIGLPKVMFLADTDLALWSTGAPVIWRGLPFVMLMLLAALQGIDHELYDATAVDGANRWQQFWYLTLPMIVPALRVLILMEVIWMFNLFDIVWILTKGGPGNATQLLAIYAYYKAFFEFDLGYASAIGTIIFALMIVFSMVFVRVAARKV
jgi:ABC-type sugar transport system permease subunit